MCHEVYIQKENTEQYTYFLHGPAPPLLYAIPQSGVVVPGSCRWLSACCHLVWDTQHCYIQECHNSTCSHCNKQYGVGGQSFNNGGGGGED